MGLQGSKKIMISLNMKPGTGQLKSHADRVKDKIRHQHGLILTKKPPFVRGECCRVVLTTEDSVRRVGPCPGCVDRSLDPPARRVMVMLRLSNICNTSLG